MQKITLSLWFEACAEQAAEFYVACFGQKGAQQGRILHVARKADGEAVAVTFALFGQNYLAINGAKNIAFTPALSLQVACETQDEIDHYWGQLAAGGKPMRCGWIADRFGVSWQIIPKNFGELVGKNGGQAMAAACQMQKIDIAALERAAEASL